MTYCPECKHFIYCDPYKMLDYKIHNIDCEEFEERKAKNDSRQKDKECSKEA